MWIHTWISQTCFFQTLGLGKVQNHEVRGFLIHTILRSFTFTYSPNLAHPAMVTFYQNKTSCSCSASFARAWPASAQNWWACCVFGFGANGSRHICFPGQEPRHQKKKSKPTPLQSHSKRGPISMSSTLDASFWQNEIKPTAKLVLIWHVQLLRAENQQLCNIKEKNSLSFSIFKL